MPVLNIAHGVPRQPEGSEGVLAKAQDRNLEEVSADGTALIAILAPQA
jgi:hypothetical protein